MIEYPKLETIYNRDEKTHKVIIGQLRMSEFANIKQWYVTEKIDGTNIRVSFLPNGTVKFNGRTDNAQMPAKLMEYLKVTFPPEIFTVAFESALGEEITLFGEGYGEKIQNGGAYRKSMSFRLFDVKIGPLWLELYSISDIADRLGIGLVPQLGFIDYLPESSDALKAIIGNDGRSLVAIQDGGQGCMAEGIVARTSPMLLTRRGDRLMWKLKFRDF